MRIVFSIEYIKLIINLILIIQGNGFKYKAVRHHGQYPIINITISSMYHKYDFSSLNKIWIRANA